MRGIWSIICETAVVFFAFLDDRVSELVSCRFFRENIVDEEFRNNYLSTRGPLIVEEVVTLLN